MGPCGTLRQAQIGRERARWMALFPYLNGDATAREATTSGRAIAQFTHGIRSACGHGTGFAGVRTLDLLAER